MVEGGSISYWDPANPAPFFSGTAFYRWDVYALQLKSKELGKCAWGHDMAQHAPGSQRLLVDTGQGVVCGACGEWLPDPVKGWKTHFPSWLHRLLLWNGRRYKVYDEKPITPVRSFGS